MATQSATTLSFGALLKRQRRLMRVTQEQLANRSGYSVSYISMLECGQRAPAANTAEILVAALELPDADRAALLATIERTIEQRHDAALARRHRVRPRGPSARAQAVGGFLGAAPEGPLVARTAELEALEMALESAQDGAGRLVMLTGEPGIGKTRLAQELAQRADARGALVATGCCYEPHATTAFYVVREVFGALYAAAPKALRQMVAKQWSAVLSLLPNAPARAHTAPVTTTLNDQQLLFRQLTGFVLAVASTQPVVVLLDDLHWADVASLDFLGHLARQTRGAGVLLVGTYRDVEMRRQPALRALLLEMIRERLVERVALRRLDLEETAALVGAALVVLEPGMVAEDLAQMIHRTTEGHPFFALEMLRALVTWGDVTCQAGRWDRRAMGDVELPENVREMVEAQVARLGPSARALLEDASVLGQTFTFDLVRRMNARPADEVEAALEEALAAELAREAGGLGYIFNHALTQRAIYGAIPAPRRRRLHHSAGEALETLPEHERRRRAAELAWHFRQGDDRERALTHTLLAGEEAERVYAHSEAHAHFSVAIDLALDGDDEAREARARECRADVSYLLGRPNDAYADLQRVTQIYRAIGDRERLAWATCQMVKAGDPLGRVEEGLRIAEELLNTLSASAGDMTDAGDTGSPPRDGDSESSMLSLRARTERAVATLSERTATRVALCLTSHLAFVRRSDEAIALAALTVAHARRANNLPMESLAHSFCAVAQSQLGRLDDARASLNQALSTGEAGDDCEAQFVALAHLAEVHELMAEPRATRTALLRALEMLARLDDVGRRGEILYLLGVNAFILGDWEDARARLSDAVASLARGDGSTPLTAELARLALLRLDLSEGKQALGPELNQIAMPRTPRQHDGEQSIPAHPVQRRVFLAYRSSDPVVDAYAIQAVAEAHILADTDADVRDPLRAMCQEGDPARPSLSGMLALLAWVELLLAHQDEAARLLIHARQHAAARHDRSAYATIWRIEALLALRQEQWDAAARLLNEALALCQAMPAPYDEAKALSVYGQLHQVRGEPDAARARYVAALAILNRLGERLHARWIERALADLEAGAQSD